MTSSLEPPRSAITYITKDSQPQHLHTDLLHTYITPANTMACFRSEPKPALEEEILLDALFYEDTPQIKNGKTRNTRLARRISHQFDHLRGKIAASVRKFTCIEARKRRRGDGKWDELAHTDNSTWFRGGEYHRSQNVFAGIVRPETYHNYPTRSRNLPYRPERDIHW